MHIEQHCPFPQFTAIASSLAFENHSEWVFYALRILIHLCGMSRQKGIKTPTEHVWITSRQFKLNKYSGSAHYVSTLSCFAVFKYKWFVSINTTKSTMFSTRSVLILLMATLVMLALSSSTAAAAYRKPPFNGSIFGKRSGNGMQCVHFNF